MVTTAGGDLARLKVLAEEQPGPPVDEADSGSRTGDTRR
jgi:hypothetical protein